MSKTHIKGKVWKFGDDINTDIIIWGKYKYSILDLKELSKHAMEAISPGFAEKISSGDIIVAGKNFGCGSSREHAPLVLKYAGVGAVVAKFFARIFYRNAFAVGLPVIECPELFDKSKEGDEFEIDLEKGVILNLNNNESFKIKPMPSFLLDILKEGSLVEHFKKHGGF
ncbi:MAG: 3-isopropylmalate dehydratase small subunit [Candidatus Bathyarchaeota archaeon]|nr:MAG: 3-isopropylmalate dehydratase small subunit [Candidatus Bathyarchaeota archaeon]